MQRLIDRQESAVQMVRQFVERVQPANFVMEAQKQVVRDGKQRAFKRSEDRQFIFGPLDGGQRGAQSFHFLAAMKRFRSNQQMRNLAGLQAPDIIASNVSTEIGEAAKQQADVPGRNRQQLLRVLRVPH